MKLRTTFAFIALAASASAALINGSFESPAGLPLELVDSTNDEGAFGWTVVSGSVETVANNLNGSDLVAEDGVRYLDLDGFSGGHISQSMATVIGQTYLLTFVYSNNPFPGSTIPAGADVQLSDAQGVIGVNAIFHDTAAIAGGADWTPYSQMFVAREASTSVDFISFGGGASLGGILLDAVSLDVSPIVIPEPSTFGLVMAAVGLVMIGRKSGVRRKL